jgi:hypothetical protein
MWTKEAAVFFKGVSRDFPARTEKTHEKPHLKHSVSRPYFELGTS